MTEFTYNLTGKIYKARKAKKIIKNILKKCIHTETHTKKPPYLV